MFVIPAVVSVVSSWAVMALTRSDAALLEHQIQAINRFPDQNPNPVLRATRAGTPSYASAAAAPIVEGLRLTVGGVVPADIMASFIAIATEGAAPLRVTSAKPGSWRRSS